MALHVGCARWGKKSNDPRIYFYPGRDEESNTYSATVTEAYCDLHAGDITQEKYVITKRRPTVDVETSSKTKSRPSSNVDTSTSLPMKHKKKINTEKTLPRSSSKPQNNDSIYHQKKRLRDEAEADILKDILKQIRKAQEQKLPLKDTISRCKSFWKEHSGLTKSEFVKVWNSVKEQASSQLFSISDSNNFTNDNSKSTRTESVRKSGNNAQNTSPSNTKHKNRWSYLFVPNYTGMFNFDKWDSVKVISQSSIKSSSSKKT